MASVMERFKKGNAKRASSSSEWSRSGSFLHKPDRGWIHPDEQLTAGGGICYGVRYIGCLEVKESMRALDFDTRTALAREAINRVSEAAGLKNATKKKKVDKKIGKMLGDTPCMQYAGSNVNLTITVDSINLMIMESGELIADHLMPGISFASGGDAETLDFVAYVAKDEVNGRSCHILECGGGLSEDVITTIGQAFELRFKEYLKKQPKPVHIPDRFDSAIKEDDAWGGNNEDESEYYNDNPSAQPPSPTQTTASEYSSPTSNLPVSPPSNVSESFYDFPHSNKPVGDTSADLSSSRRPRIPSEYDFPPSSSFDASVSDGVYSSVKEEGMNGFSYATAKDVPLIDLNDNATSATYDNRGEKTTDIDSPEQDSGQPDFYDNNKLKKHAGENGSLDPFDMEPFSSSLPDHGASRSTVPEEPAPLSRQHRISPMFEEWFHGNLTRKEAEKMLQLDGDFLVRQSASDANQYVLSGRQNGIIKHLLLVDPEGVVRTKDHSFDSVPHLINFHRSQDIPIVSQESELHLKRPISNKLTAI